MQFTRTLALTAAVGATVLGLSAPASAATYNATLSGSSLCAPPSMQVSTTSSTVTLSSINFSCSYVTTPSSWTGPLSGSTGSVSATVNVSSPFNCSYSGTVNVAFSGGTPATGMTLSGSLNKTSGGFLCPNPYTLSLNYTLS